MRHEICLSFIVPQEGKDRHIVYHIIGWLYKGSKKQASFFTLAPLQGAIRLIDRSGGIG